MGVSETEPNIRNKLAPGETHRGAHAAMSGSGWRYVLAMVGLIAVFGLLHAGYQQLDRAEKQSYPKQEYQPARDHLAPASGKNPAVTANPYQPYCDHPKDRDDADLCAQWAAVMAVEEGNRLNRLSLRLTALEFLALVISLIFTGWAAFAAAKAAKAAQDAVSVAKDSAKQQLRPYLDAYEGWAKIKCDNGSLSYDIKLVLRNNGQTRAMILKETSQSNVLNTKKIHHLFGAGGGWTSLEVNQIVGPTATYPIFHSGIDAGDISIGMHVIISVGIMVEYSDYSGDEHTDAIWWASDAIQTTGGLDEVELRPKSHTDGPHLGLTWEVP
ncbi:hypothetical protein [Hansschlegelia sp.]|uniref:hypothetical protein n=1 Tax=Hansschlegelia sp. TaxID=2041892 RepID=UPI002B901395|nr:hypothetical protein [Hansschlegelia sp.]HVI27038.1 hypothetical protein [Hansschlegelia sp.]